MRTVASLDATAHLGSRHVQVDDQVRPPQQVDRVVPSPVVVAEDCNIVQTFPINLGIQAVETLSDFM